MTQGTMSQILYFTARSTNVDKTEVRGKEQRTEVENVSKHFLQSLQEFKFLSENAA
jgi:hypothetical protein